MTPREQTTPTWWAVHICQSCGKRRTGRWRLCSCPVPTMTPREQLNDAFRFFLFVAVLLGGAIPYTLFLYQWVTQ